MFCIITNQTEANVWFTSVALDQLLRRLILVTYASSRWREKKFIIERVINVKTLNGSEHDERSFVFIFFIEIENFRGEGTILMRYTYDTTFSEQILDFYKILEESEQFFILFFKENRKSEAVFQHFWSARRQLKKKLHSGKSGASEIQRTNI